MNHPLAQLLQVEEASTFQIVQNLDKYIQMVFPLIIQLISLKWTDIKIIMPVKDKNCPFGLF